MDLRVREQYGFGTMLPGCSAASAKGGFSQILFATSQAIDATDYESIFQAASDAYQVPAALLKAVAKAESSFNPNALSSCGAQGIMQLMPATARSLGVTNAFDPVQNIMGGAKYLRQMLDAFDGNTTLALAAYNAGPGAVQKYGGVPPYQETQNYVAKVLGYAGGSVSASPAASVSTGSAPDQTWSSEELVDMIFQADRSASGRESTRLLVQQLLREKNEEELAQL